jgi:glutathione S-transferase
MKLRVSSTSPYSRKCQIVALEAGLGPQVELVQTSPWVESDLPDDNPLGKVPVLITGGGEAIYDSPVICQYLDSLHDGHKLVPPSGGARWTHLRLEALADGILDALIIKRVETAMRPKELVWADWLARQDRAVARGLAVLDTECQSWGGEFLIGQIAAVAALGYLDFRFKEYDWRSANPHLAAWEKSISVRASVVQSLPKE